MANNQSDTTKDVNQSGVTTNKNQNQQQKKAFEQGNGNTTAGSSTMQKNPDLKTDKENDNRDKEKSNRSDESKSTTQDPKIIHKGDSMNNEIPGNIITEDDTDTDEADVDENSEMNDRKKNEPEIDAPVPGTEKPEKKYLK